ncbi:PREDICTED: insulin-like growth factor-binding protein 2-B [Poecilia mexicana]|uniref:Thyroglobulin type-1 domain-containing protein n=1 Tax=Poecilia mexicana TaxID=48701 RepID=A0A3B3YXY1_9TELE|nr:PREDICTED: insulin-like growth factor-binding protein 2-B [Poecilia mexicana]XP_014825014.1 PREDICTED: insulin-like growth factor-binding protein 2-B [Poecilia mexicana]
MFGLLLAVLALPGLLRGDLVFRCPRCTAENQDGCPKVTLCTEIVREPGCGCCPVCARLEGEFCGVYTPRCSTGLLCSPSMDAELPLQQLIQGFGRCTRSVEQDLSLDLLPTNEVHGTESPLVKRPLLDPWNRQEKTRLQIQNELRTRMRTSLHDERVQRDPPSSCQQELDMVLEEISRMTSEDNRGPLENLYGLKFPNCDRHGLYNLKQCNMSTHGQRGECWCVDPLTGVQIPETPRVRGDPNCNHFQEALRAPATTAR